MSKRKATPKEKEETKKAKSATKEEVHSEEEIEQEASDEELEHWEKDRSKTFTQKQQDGIKRIWQLIQDAGDEDDYTPLTDDVMKPIESILRSALSNKNWRPVKHEQ